MPKKTRPSRTDEGLSAAPEKGREHVSIYLLPDVAQALRIAAVEDRKRISALAEALIVEGLKARATLKKGRE